MGKGDKKTKKGKINKGTYGVRRNKSDNKKSTAKAIASVAAPVVAEVEKKVVKPKKVTVKE
ncbi:MAG: 30S ribosomal protein THX [Cytophagales bacterium]|nr:30S ribosomal protein THX [Cytophagales bacterium]